MKKLMLGAMIAAVACGCVSYNKNTGDDADLRQWVVKDVVHVKMTAGKKAVSAENQINSLFCIIRWGGYNVVADQSDELLPLMAEEAKNGAYAKACDMAKCDQLAAARYKVTTKDYLIFKSVKAEVTGYPVTVSGVEVIEHKGVHPSVSKVEVR